MTEAGADLFKGSDRFTVTRRIGQGAMGVVYEAHDRLRQMPVAVKTIAGGDPTALYRFKREFRSLSNITHRNLATLYELVADTTPWFYTMELVTGVTFLEYVRPSGSVQYQRLSAALSDLPPGTTVLTQGDMSSWVLWSQPQLRLPFDSRSEIYSRQYHLDFARLMAAAPGWGSVLDRTRASYALVLKDSPIAAALVERKHWSPVATDHAYVLLSAAP